MFFLSKETEHVIIDLSFQKKSVNNKWLDNYNFSYSEDFFLNDCVWNVDAIKLFMADRHTEDQTDPYKQLRWLKTSCTHILYNYNSKI